jgi:prevent-host-death family protein
MVMTMKDLTVSTREMSRGFTKLLREVAEGGAEVTVTSRGRPVAILCPYERYRRVMRKRSLERLMELADGHLEGLTLEETYYSSRKDLETSGGDG